MALPTATRAYTFSVNNRISYVSLNDTVARYLYGIKNFLVATMAYTVKYTCDGTTGPTSGSDHTDRWASQANVTTRGANSTTAQSFCVLTDANGVDILLAYQGASDDIFRVAFSSSGIYLPAGTANQQPTATDESTCSSLATMIGSVASADRVWHIMAATDKKSFRVFITRAGNVVGVAFGVETVVSAMVSPAVFSPATVGFSLTSASFSGAGAFNTGVQTTRSVVARPIISSVGFNAIGGYAYESTATGAMLDGVNCELQGSNGALVFPVSAFSVTASAQGKIGNLIDFYKSGNSKADGDTSTDKLWIHLTGFGSASAGLLWPWDGTSVPAFS